MAKFKLSLLLAVLVVQTSFSMEEPTDTTVHKCTLHAGDLARNRAQTESNVTFTVIGSNIPGLRPRSVADQRAIDRVCGYLVGRFWNNPAQRSNQDPIELTCDPRPMHERSQEERDAEAVKAHVRKKQAFKHAAFWGLGSLAGFSISFFSWKYNWCSKGASMVGGGVSAAALLKGSSFYPAIRREKAYLKALKDASESKIG